MIEPSSGFILRVRHGSAEAKVIRFHPGEETRPISLGRDGDWRMEGPGVENLHAYVKFDGRRVWAMGVHAKNPPRIEGRAIGELWTPLPVPSVLTVGALRIVLDHADDEEPPVEPPAEPPPGDEIHVELEDATPGPPPWKTSTRIFGSEEIAAWLQRAPGAAPPPDVGPSGAQPFDPARTRVLDMSRLWPDLQLTRAAEPSLAPVATPPRATDRGRAALAPAPETAVAADGVPAGLRRAPRRGRALAIALPVTAFVLLVRLAMDPGVRSLIGAASAQTPGPASSAGRSVAATSPPPASAPGSVDRDVRAAAAPAPLDAPPSGERGSVAPTANVAPRASVARAAMDAEPPAPTRKGPLPRGLEREAVDAVARADYGAARRLYEELALAHPERSVFRESARILAEKMAAPPR